RASCSGPSPIRWAAPCRRCFPASGSRRQRAEAPECRCGAPARDDGAYAVRGVRVGIRNLSSGISEITKTAIATKALFHTVARDWAGIANAEMNSHTASAVFRNRICATRIATSAKTTQRTPRIQVLVSCDASCVQTKAEMKSQIPSNTFNVRGAMGPDLLPDCLYTN